MIYPEFEELLELGYKASKLNLMSRRRVRSIVSGDHRSPFRGKGLEFEEVREYVPGDDVRNIDWRVTARTGMPHLKLFTEERERSVLVCNDVNDTMRFGTRGTFKSIQAARTAALLGWAASRENNRVGGSFFGNVPGGMLFLEPVRTRRSLWRMLKQLCDRKEYFSDAVLMEEHLRYLNKAAPSGSLVFILSDFINITDNLKKRLSNLHRKADVVLIAVNDPSDRHLPSAGPLIFEGSDNEKLAVNTSDKKGGRAYERLWTEKRRLLENIIASLGLGYVTLGTEGDVYFDLVKGLKRLDIKGTGNGRSAFAA
jgi:uncharacterized protein (DUF58 family)